MNFDRPVLVLDIEATGVDPQKDRIVELGICVLSPGGLSVRSWSARFHPGMPIPPAATAVHHINDADVESCDPFEKSAAQIHRGLQGRDLAGYNLRRFDLPILDEELRRCGLKLSLEGVRVIDVAGIFFKKEPRKLEDAVRRYCGREHADAHGALPDAIATAQVLLGQLAEYPELAALPLAELADYSLIGDRQPADIAGKLYYDQEGKLCYGFGKYKGTRVEDEPGYADWILSRDFPGSTVEVLRAELERIDRSQQGSLYCEEGGTS